MIRRRLGPGGPEISALGIGAMSFGPFYGPVTETQAHAVLDAALDAGVTHLDTANVYGMGLSEDRIGSYLARYRGAGGLPFRVATKAAITTDAEGRRGFDNAPGHLEAELDASLKRLRLEHVDLFYVHRRDPRFEIEAVTETLVALMRKGKIGSIGFSEIAPASLRRAAAVHPVAAVQSEYSLQTRLPELGLIQTCAELGTTLVAFSPVGRGLLTDRPPSRDRIAASDFLKTNPRFMGDAYTRNLAASDRLRAIGRAHGIPAASLAIGWVIAQSPAIVTIPGTNSTAHFAELVQGAAAPLDPAILREIDDALPPGWCEGARYNDAQMIGPEQYC